MEKELVVHPSGLTIRKNSYDTEIIKEVARSYGWMDVKDKVVLDIGANFGAYTSYALKNGAKEVWAFEPEPENFALLQKNVGDDPRAKIFNGAIIRGENTTIDFYLTTGTNHGSYSMFSYRGREKITVKAHQYSKVLDKVKPQCIKCDCEGAEYDFFVTRMPESVEQVVMELHYNCPAGTSPKWYHQALKITAMFANWETVKEPKRNEKLWHTIGGWRKKQLSVQ